MEIVRSPYRCQECDKPFQTNTPTRCAVEVYCSFIMSLRCPSCGGAKLTLGYNLREAEDIALRISGTTEERARNWHANGEIGTSSLTIYHKFLGTAHERRSTPADLSDLRRCAFLLEHVPEWKMRMGEMASVSGWEKLSSNWNALISQFRSEAPDLRGAAPLTSSLLDQLTRPSDRNTL